MNASYKQRVEFERWFKENHTQNVQKINGEYVHGSTERLWQAWCAAISSVVVDIKNLPSASYTSSGVVYLSDVAEAIEKARVRHKTNKCKTCDMNCSGMCTKDDDSYKPERALQWLGVTVIAWCGLFMWWVLS